MWAAILTIAFMGQVASEGADLGSQVAVLTEQLESGSAEENRQAEEALIQLGQDALEYLPKITADTPERTRIQLQRIRKAIVSSTKK